MTESRCGDCNGKIVGDYVYELKENSAPLVCEDCFENYLAKWGVEKERWAEVKEQARFDATRDDLEPLRSRSSKKEV